MDRTSNNIVLSVLALLGVLGIWWWALFVPLRILEEAMTPPEEIIEDATGPERPFARPRLNTVLAAPPTRPATGP